MKKVLITGDNSYIGDAVKKYLEQESNNYDVDTIDTVGISPSVEMFSPYDVVFNVAGIAHIKETKDNRHLYYDINRDLVVKIANTAKEAGVKQFILLSSMSVYGKTTGFITKETIPRPTTSYGDSKLQADELIKRLEDNDFVFTCLRPPMVYGKGCKGNYQKLRSFALKFPVFPNYSNQRSMIFVGNLACFVKQCIDEKKSGLFFPQNAEYINTSKMVERIAQENDKAIRLTKAFNWAIRILHINVIKKVFGDLVYESIDTVNQFGFEESIRMTEN